MASLLNITAPEDAICIRSESLGIIPICSVSILLKPPNSLLLSEKIYHQTVQFCPFRKVLQQLSIVIYDTSTLDFYLTSNWLIWSWFISHLKDTNAHACTWSPSIVCLRLDIQVREMKHSSCSLGEHGLLRQS